MTEHDEKLIKQALGHLPLRVKLKKLDSNAVVPTYAHDGDVGMDVTAIGLEYDVANDTYIYHTGLTFESYKHYGIFLFPRSSKRRTDAYLTNHVGIDDSSIYRGEIMWCFKLRDSIKTMATNAWADTLRKTRDMDKANDVYVDIINKDPIEFAPYKVGEKIGQMVAWAYPDVRFDIVDELSETERGDKGFGSTGV